MSKVYTPYQTAWLRYGRAIQKNSLTACKWMIIRTSSITATMAWQRLALLFLALNSQCPISSVPRFSKTPATRATSCDPQRALYHSWIAWTRLTLDLYSTTLSCCRGSNWCRSSLMCKTQPTKSSTLSVALFIHSTYLWACLSSFTQ